MERMTEYVDRHKVSDACYEIYEEVVRAGKAMTDQEVKDTLLRFERAIKGVPAADVEPVVHAHWVVDDEYLTCSHCSESYLAGDTSHEVRELLDRGEAYKRCPHCGAKMDGGDAGGG